MIIFFRVETEMPFSQKLRDEDKNGYYNENGISADARIDYIEITDGKEGDDVNNCVKDYCNKRYRAGMMNGEIIDERFKDLYPRFEILKKPPLGYINNFIDYKNKQIKNLEEQIEQLIKERDVFVKLIE